MPDFSIIAETTLRPAALDDVVDDVMDSIEDYAGTIAGNDRGRLELILTIPATGLRQAAATGLTIAEAALGKRAKVASIEVMTTKEFDARIDAIKPPAIPELVSITEAAQLLGVSRQAVHQRLETGSLPGVRVGTTWVIPRAGVRPA